MGAAQSLEVPGGGSDGYNVLRVQENSPGSRAGLEPFFDYIIAVNGIRLVRLAFVALWRSVDEANAMAFFILCSMKIHHF
jgi:predicted metalloprotease with PDZ domain